MAQKVRTVENIDSLDPLLRRKQVCAALGVKDTSVYKLVKLKKLAPARRHEGLNRVGWRTSDVRRYLDGLPPAELRPMPGAEA